MEAHPDHLLTDDRVERFRRTLGSDGSVCDLARTALLLGTLEDEQLDPQPWLARLDALAVEVQARLNHRGRRPDDGRAAVEELTGFLYGELGLRGNAEDYYDPANSFLHRVLDRGLGIPISLALVVVEVGRRVGIPLQGVGLPGHFLVRWSGPGASFFLDPFAAGRLLDEAGCAQLLNGLGLSVPFSRELLQPVGAEATLTRMLRNLKGAYLRRRDPQRAVAALDLLLTLAPKLHAERRDRGLLLLGIGRWGRAVTDLERYLGWRPDAPDAPEVRRSLEDARRRLWTLN